MRILVALALAAVAAIALAIHLSRTARAADGERAAGAHQEDGADLLAAGDVGQCNSAGPGATARLMARLPGTIALLGDAAYPMGSDEDFRRCFAPAWGPLKERIRPVPGNHEYRTESGAPYYRYFGAQAGQAGKGYYSYELGTWHVVALNSNLSVSAQSAQMQWLRADLARVRGDGR